MISKEECNNIIENFENNNACIEVYESPHSTLILHKLETNKYLVLKGNSQFKHSSHYPIGCIVNVKDSDVITTDFLSDEFYLVDWEKVLLAKNTK